MQGDSYDVPLPGELRVDVAQAATIVMISILNRLNANQTGPRDLPRRPRHPEGDEAGGDGDRAPFEGAEAIDRDFRLLDLLYAAGLRSIGIVWSRPNIFGHGVPFRFPGSPDTGPGLTDLGKELVRACNRLRILIDLSHLNEQGFWDVASISTAPLVATHSERPRHLSDPRNLTEKQLDAIRDSHGWSG